MITATITRIYQIELPSDSNLTPDELLSEWLENARKHPETFDVLIQDDVDGIINRGSVSLSVPDGNEARTVADVALSFQEGGDCYPFKLENFTEALLSMDEDLLALVASQLRLYKMSEAGFEIFQAVVEYWINRATSKV